jgi:hypothetical protein
MVADGFHKSIISRVWSYKSLTPDSNSDWDNLLSMAIQSQYGTNRVEKDSCENRSVYSVEKLQNYVFTGKPSGTICFYYLIILVGNPYPSALDAVEFIKDNIKVAFDEGSQNSFVFLLRDHFGLSNSHPCRI